MLMKINNNETSIRFCNFCHKKSRKQIMKENVCMNGHYILNDDGKYTCVLPRSIGTNIYSTNTYINEDSKQMTKKEVEEWKTKNHMSLEGL